MAPAYTYSVPDFQMVSGGYAALSHIMEIYFSSPDENKVSDDLAEALMKLEKIKRFAIHVWGVQAEGNSDEQIAETGIEALTGFIREIGLLSTLQELMADKKTDLKMIANSCIVISRGYRRMVHQEILEFLRECDMK